MQIQYRPSIAFAAKKQDAPKPEESKVTQPNQPVGGYFQSPQAQYEKKSTQEFVALLKANGFDGKINPGSGVSFPAHLGKIPVTVYMMAMSEAEENKILAVLDKIASQPHQEIRKGSDKGIYFFRGYPVKIHRMDLDPGQR